MKVAAFAGSLGIFILIPACLLFAGLTAPQQAAPAAAQISAPAVNPAAEALAPAAEVLPPTPVPVQGAPGGAILRFIDDGTAWQVPQPSELVFACAQTQAELAEGGTVGQAGGKLFSVMFGGALTVVAVDQGVWISDSNQNVRGGAVRVRNPSGEEFWMDASRICLSH